MHDTVRRAKEVTVSDARLDDDIVAAAGRGEPQAVRAVWLELSPLVLGYLRAKGVADPEAVTSDVFLAVLPQLPRVSGGAAGLRKLTFAIAHARMVDDHRSRTRAPQAVPYEPADDTRTTDSAEAEACGNLAVHAVRSVLRLLPDDQQEVLRLRVIADLSLEQTAAIMGRSTGAVKQLQRRGLLALKAALAERRVTL